MVKSKENATEYALRYVLSHDGDTPAMATHIEEDEGTEILSMGNALELIKDLGDATESWPTPMTLADFRAPTGSATPGWPRNRTWISSPLGPPLLGLPLQRHLRRP